MKKSIISHSELTRLLSFNPETGVFTWNISPRFSVKAGSIAGSVRNYDGYRTIGIGGRTYRASRLAWFYVHGIWPSKFIDHINANRSDDRIQNLRNCTPAVNTQNQRLAHANNATGVLGVTKNGSKSKPYRAQINVNGKIRYIGVFESPELAHQAYLSEKRKVHEGCTL